MPYSLATGLAAGAEPDWGGILAFLRKNQRFSLQLMTTKCLTLTALRLGNQS